MLKFEPSDKIKQLPTYPFVKLEQAKQRAKEKGMDIIDLGIGDPDLPTPNFIIEEMKRAILEPEYHRYPSSQGMLLFREAVCDWMKRRFRVRISPEDVVSLIGSKEGLAHFPIAYINPGDITLVPSPAYPVYKIGTIFAGGKPYIMPLKEESDFLPRLDLIPRSVLKKAKILFLNYPNNPTSAIASLELFEEVVWFALKNNIIVAHDCAYSEVTFDGYKSPSILEVPKAKQCAIEFHSLSKSFNMTGWRIGFAVGAKELVQLLSRVKSNIDSGIFQAIQVAGAKALRKGEGAIKRMREIYQGRRDVLAEGLDSIGLKYHYPKATFYFWVKVPKGFSSEEFVALLLDKTGILASPGNGYGEEGEGFFRLAIVSDEKRIKEAVKRLRNLSL